jgi:flagellar M-ring protein FliF
VNVVNASFTQEAAAPASDGELESPKIWESPLFLEVAKIVGGLVVLLVLVLSVIRPLIRTLIGPAAHQMSVAVLPRAAAAAEPIAPQALPGAAQAAATVNHEQQVMQARTLVNQDPKRVAQVVRGWVAKDD